MQNVVNLQDVSEFRPERIRGFKKLLDSELVIPQPMKIIMPVVYKTYRDSGTLKEEVREEIETSFDEIKSKNPDKGVIVRSAYYLSEKKIVAGPRSSAINDRSRAAGEVERILKFALDQELVGEQDEICAILHPFIAPNPPESAGSLFTSYDRRGKYSMIAAIYGCAEGVQSFPHDSYLVEAEAGRIESKNVSRKNKVTKVDISGELTTHALPDELINRQVLTDEEIVELARSGKGLERRFGPHELEFSLLKDELYFIDCRPHRPEMTSREAEESFIHTVATSSEILIRPITGRVVRIRAKEDLSQIRANSLLYFEPEVEKDKKLRIIAEVASFPRRMTILYPSSFKSTAHPLLILKEAGHLIVFVPGREFKDGDLVKIVGRGKFVEIRYL